MVHDEAKNCGGRGGWLSGVAVFALLAALVLISYAGALGADFVYDDYFQLVENLSIRDLRNIPLFFTDPAKTTTSMIFEEIYRPLRTTCFAVEYQLWELNPAAYHAVNLFFHLLNSFLVFLFIRRIIGAHAPALIAAALFAAHPALTEDVCWICSRSDLLCMFFYIAALLGYLRSREEAGRRRAAFYGVALAASALAMLSKEMAVTFPAAVVAIDFRREGMKGQTPGRWLSYAPFVVLAAVYLIIRINIMSLFAQRAHWGDTPLAAAAIMAKSVAYYIGILTYPFGLTVFPAIDTNVSLHDAAAVFAVVLVLGLIAAAVALRRKCPTASLGVVLFFILLLPASNIIPLKAIVADRFVYLPSLGFFIVAAALVQGIWASENSHSRRNKALLAGAIAAIVVLLSVNTIARSLDWRTSVSLFESAVEVAPDSPRARAALGKELFSIGDLEAAGRQAVAALERDPRHPGAHSLLGRINHEQGRMEEAEKEFRISLEGDPDDNYTNNALGTIYKDRGMLDEALALFERSSKKQPIVWKTLNNAGSVLLEKGELSAALEYFDEALEVKPDSVEAAYNKAITLLGLNRHADATRFIEDWRSRHSDEDRLLTLLGLAYSRGGDYEAAINAYRLALEANPSDVRASAYLADLHMGRGEYDKAVSLYKSVLKAQPAGIRERFLLAAALEKTGRLDEAVEQIRAAIHFRPDDASLQEKLAELLEKVRAQSDPQSKGAGMRQ